MVIIYVNRSVVTVRVEIRRSPCGAPKYDARSLFGLIRNRKAFIF
jgi:hypothetical protein